MTLAALFVSSLAMAQMPYNPDSNGDNMVGSGDLLTFLTFYGNELIQSDLTCDYEGTELEQLFGGLFDQSLVLDSVYLEYLLLDSVETFLPGCPDPVTIETVLSRGIILTQIIYSFNQGPNYYIYADSNYLGYFRRVQLIFNNETGHYSLTVIDNEVSSLFPYSNNSYWLGGSNGIIQMPFPGDWALGIDGIQVNWLEGWVSNCEHFRLIPFWSVAE